jgi:hypothetical protein
VPSISNVPKYDLAKRVFANPATTTNSIVDANATKKRLRRAALGKVDVPTTATIVFTSVVQVGDSVRERRAFDELHNNPGVAVAVREANPDSYLQDISFGVASPSILVVGGCEAS